MNIDKTSFGSITIDKKIYDVDVIISSNKVMRRVERPLGSHIIALDEIKDIIKDKPTYFILGQGQNNEGLARLEDAAKKELEKNKIKIMEMPTPKAIKKFNEIKDKKAGLFHVTC